MSRSSPSAPGIRCSPRNQRYLNAGGRSAAKYRLASAYSAYTVSPGRVRSRSHAPTALSVRMRPSWEVRHDTTEGEDAVTTGHAAIAGAASRTTATATATRAPNRSTTHRRPSAGERRERRDQADEVVRVEQPAQREAGQRQGAPDDEQRTALRRMATAIPIGASTISGTMHGHDVTNASQSRSARWDSDAGRDALDGQPVVRDGEPPAVEAGRGAVQDRQEHGDRRRRSRPARARAAPAAAAASRARPPAAAR